MADRDQLSLLDRLRDPGFTASIFTTFNAYLPFYEHVVLRRLLAAGCQHNVVLMDARQLATALGDPSQQPRRAGREYTLIPVRMKGAFHPKVLLRLGKKRGALHVGSHNLTLAGFGMNHEMTSAFVFEGSDREDVALFISAIEEIRLSVPVDLAGVGEAFDAAVRSAPWLNGPAPISKQVWALGNRSSSASLWSRIKDLVEGDPQRILICGPFFDEGLALLEVARRDFPAAVITVALQPASVEIEPSKASSISGVKFVDVSGCLPVSHRRAKDHPYLHAKAMWFQTSEGELLVTGSANPSAAAYLAGPESRNAEVVTVRWSRGTSDSLLAESELASFLTAPELTDDEWGRIRTRRETESPPSAPGDQALLAEVTDDGFMVDGAIPAGAIVTAMTTDGVELGRVVIAQASPPALLHAGEDIRHGASRLVADSGVGLVHILVHRTAEITELYASDSRRALRQALGSLDEDPSQIGHLLRLSEKVIFDFPDVDAGDLASAATNSSPTGSTSTVVATTAGTAPPASLAVEARGGRGTARRTKRVAAGDIAALLDALIHRLGVGLPDDLSAPGVSRPSEEELVGTEDGPAPPLTLAVDYASLARACRRKVRTLCKRMREQIAQVVDDPAPASARRIVVQAAAVLSVLRLLVGMETRPEWRRRELLLVARDDLDDLRAVATEDCAGPQKLLALAASIDGEPFEEQSILAALLVWATWQAGFDLHLTRATPGDPLDLMPANDLADLAPWMTLEAADILRDAILRTERTQGLGAEWLERHVDWMVVVAPYLADEAAAVKASVQGIPRPGDLVLLPVDITPRLRIALGTRDGTQGTVVAVAGDRGKLKSFLAARLKIVQPLASSRPTARNATRSDP